jgi:hypothetical protein
MKVPVREIGGSRQTDTDFWYSQSYMMLTKMVLVTGGGWSKK